MARKDRAPNPPKRPQAPQRRSTPADPAAKARQRRLLAVIAGSGIAALAIVLAIIFFTGGDERRARGDRGRRLHAAELPGAAERVRPLGRPHADDEAEVELQSADERAALRRVGGLGLLRADEPVPLVQTTHNLEHGGVVIHYGPDVPEAEVDKLRTWFNETSDPNGLIIAPLATNADKITLSAWTAPDAATGTTDRGDGWLATCKTFDEDAVSAFLDAHRYQGPERIPREHLAPAHRRLLEPPARPGWRNWQTQPT